ncbi:MarR family transcriptional regulator [Pyxidicoccus fallax]|uniref:MarR family transcriptional regulator n=1 Tax=Pyxidicoccus fallax TaxID=394095 RepID=A0A848LMU9_9BACT|nr:MarR family transcriptional regulator [Pyxidicoccus fallax]NMO18982.1 MarR family transcriptional regulator [Pyxidicoccus fallax]NPC83126.1 MarR family transcriptional regulator [Pyxidicoccus fallax]
MRRPDDRPAPRVQPLAADSEQEQDLIDEGGLAEEGLPPQVDGDASTPESRRLHELVIQLGRYRSLRDPLHGICEDNQLTPTQVHALMWLGNDGPTHVGLLAQRIGITKKTITGVVDRLEAMKLVERARDAEDRRAVVARLTPQGTALYDRLNHSVNHAMGRLLDLLEPEDREALFGLLERVLKRLASRAQTA